MTAFEIFAKLTADTSGFDSAMRKAGKSGNDLKGSLENTFGKIKKAAATAISVTAIKKGIDAIMDFANEVSAAGDRIDKQSQVLGMSRKAYQEWDYILGQNGASIDSMAVAMKTLNSQVESAQKGGKEAKSAFAQLGLGIHEIENLSPEDQFEAIVRAFQKMPAGAKKSALAVQIFGKQGQQLLPLLNQSEGSIDELRQKAEELGLIMSDDAVDASVEYGDSLDDLKRTFNSFKYAIGAKILPTLTSGIQKVTAYAGKLRKAYDEKGLAGVWDTLVESFRNIKWPTMEEIIAKIKEMWNGVKEAAKSVLKLVFGETADGDIAWPTPEEIEQKVRKGLTDMWQGVKDLAKGIMTLIFGETEDGGIAFPTPDELWTKISGAVTGLWDGIKALASGVLKFVFGEDENGGIDFPTAEEVWQKIQGGLDALWQGIKENAKSILKLTLNVPELPDAHTAGEMLRKKIKEWWTEIKTNIQNSVLKWFIPNPSMEDGEGTGVSAMIQDWWNNKVVPEIKKVLNFTLGLFGLPTVDEMKEKIKTWWESVKTAVGELVLNIIPNILGIGGGNSENDPGWQDNGYNPNGYTFELPGKATGSPYIPFDNYPALLHRGEQVLTATQARRRNNGEADAAALAAQMIGAVRQGMEGAQLNSYLDTTKVTRKTNAVTGRKIISRRFAPA